MSTILYEDGTPVFTPVWAGFYKSVDPVSGEYGARAGDAQLANQWLLQDGTPNYAAIPQQAPSQHEPGAKLDDGKPDASLLMQFPRALSEIAWVGTYGKTKYTRGGWQSVNDAVTRYSAALMRHMLAWAKGQRYDTDPWMDTPEGEPFKGTIRHDAQVAWNALAVLELRLREEEENNGTS